MRFGSIKASGPWHFTGFEIVGYGGDAKGGEQTFDLGSPTDHPGQEPDGQEPWQPTFAACASLQLATPLIRLHPRQEINH